MESQSILGANTVQLAGVKCVNVLKDNLLKCIMWNKQNKYGHTQFFFLISLFYYLISLILVS